MSEHKIKLTVNGKSVVATVEARVTLVDFIREHLGLTGTHIGCEHGVCGACSIMFDGIPIRSCLQFAVMADGHDITTVEGLQNSDGTLSVLQDAFWQTHALQCGYCTPGMLIAAQALLNNNPTPTDHDIREAIGGNICRCTGYVQIIEAIKLTADKLQHEQQD